MKRLKFLYSPADIRQLFYLILLSFFATSFSFAQNEADFEEISVYLLVQRVGGTEIPAVYHNQQIYLPVQDLFDFLKIRSTPSAAYDSVSGYFISQEAKYVVDKLHNRIIYGGKVFNLEPDDLVRTESNLYLRSVFFGQIFGLECTFNFRALSVTLNTKIELPVIRDMRLEFMRSNINRMKGEEIADTIIPKSRQLLRFGMADWAVYSDQEISGAANTRFNLGLGSVIAGGEAVVSLQYYANQPFQEKQQQYLWRFVNNDRRVLRQVMAGKISSQSTSSVFYPVVGMQFTNAPTTYRKSYGTYTLSDYTEPDWAVELYVNNVLVDYAKADASGFFTFEVPMMYGSTNILLRYYGPFGEEKSKQQSVTVPYNFLPAKELQYTVSAGMVEDTMHSLFSRANANYGVGRFMTIGGGMEYLSSVTSGSFMPFVNTSMRLGSNLLFSGEYTHGVRGRGILNYRTKKNFQVELNYTRYDPAQKAIIYNYLEELKAIVSFPIQGRKFSAFSRITLANNVLPATRNTTAEWLISGVLFGVSANFTTFAMLPKDLTPYVYSNLSLGLRLPGKLLFRPMIQYDYSAQQLMLAKGEIERQFFKHGYLNVSYEYVMRSKVQNIQFGFRYDFSIAQTAFTYRNSNNISTLIESARGSLLVDRKTTFVKATNRSSVGRGGIVILPFLDMNGNGKYDKGESKVLGLRININGGRVEQNKRDSVVRIFDLEPYVSYLIELDRFSFDNIAWQMHLKNMSVVVDPNQFKLVEIPISVMGEAMGMVNFSGPSGEKGLGRITVEIYRTDGTFVGKTLSESDGFFSYMGLAPGDYVARIDTAQMRKLNMTAGPDSFPFSIRKTMEGDVMDGLEFNIRSNEMEEPVKKEPEVVSQPEKKTELLAEPLKEKAVPVVEKKTEPVIQKESVTVYCIQITASKKFIEPSVLKKDMKLDDEVHYFEKDGWFKYVTGQFETQKNAAAKMAALGIKGFITQVDKAALR